MGTVFKQKNQMNQYNLVLMMSEFIRRHPGNPIIRKLKACKTQAEQMDIFTNEVLNKSGAYR